MSEAKKDVYLVVSEDCYGGGEKALRIFATQEEAKQWGEGLNKGPDYAIYTIALEKAPVMVETSSGPVKKTSSTSAGADDKKEEPTSFTKQKTFLSMRKEEASLELPTKIKLLSACPEGPSYAEISVLDHNCKEIDQFDAAVNLTHEIQAGAVYSVTSVQQRGGLNTYTLEL